MSAERYTFTQIMSSLIEIQSHVNDIYKDLAERTKNPKLAKALKDLVLENSERVESSNRVRQSTVTEFSLEPITGLRLADYAERINQVAGSKESDEAKKAAKLEGVMEELYREVAHKVIYASPDTSYLFTTFSQRSADHKLKLSSDAEP